MLEMWLSKERLLSNSTPRFLTDVEEFKEQPTSVRLDDAITVFNNEMPLTEN